MSAPYVYPMIGDWTQYVAERSPSTLGPDPQWGATTLLLDGLSVLDASTASMVMGLDPRVAVGAQLDQLGSWVDERRAGLGDAEYQRIIMGREAAQTSDGGIEALWPLWLALTGAAADSARIVVVPFTGSPTVYLQAIVLIEPSVPWRIRAGTVLRDAVAYPIDAVGVIGLSSALVWNAEPAWNTGTWGSVLPVEVD